MKNWTVDPNSPVTAEGMILRLAGTCNYASTHDGAGFSRTDAEFGHSLAAKAAQNQAWTVRQAEAALVLLKKYQRQLGSPDQVKAWLGSPVFRKEPVDAGAKTQKISTNRLLKKDGHEAVFEFSYDAVLVGEIKTRIVGEHGGKRFRPLWNSDTKRWTVPLNDASIPLILDFAKSFDFEISEDLRTYLDGFQDRAAEDKFMLALNDNRNVVLASDKILIVVDNPAIMEEFQRVLIR